ncbi:spermatogenesis-associated protein 16-like [Melanerpes formicivorus]|uniref:spermatogenesis-associated protein 16-like n=1 Tax=Melanerpes formicivorus TaxID=211600 RepID=UPI00358F4150
MTDAPRGCASGRVTVATSKHLCRPRQGPPSEGVRIGEVALGRNGGLLPNPSTSMFNGLGRHFHVPVMAAIWKYKLRAGRVDIDEKTLENRENTASETGNESTPTHLPHTSTLHPQIGAAENKESMEVAEKRTNERGDNDRGQMRTKQSDDTVQVSRKRKLDDNETPTEKKVQKLNTGNESIPIPGSHTPILSPGCGAAENKAQRKRSKQSNDVVKASCKETLETNEKPAEESDSNLAQLSHNLRCIEKRLVYTDKEDISLEFAEARLSTSTQSACCDSGKAGPSPAPHGRTLPRTSRQFKLAIDQARACYGHRNYAGAMEHLSTALKLCSNGASVENPLEASADDISSIASFIETKLAMCCLKMKRPSDALTHAHRSISKNPTHFRNHMRQAAAFWRLGRYSEAARSAMIADYMYWLMGGTRKRTSKYIRYYWQAMIEEAITAETSYTVMYTPLETEGKEKDINKIQRAFAKRNPEYLQHQYTDPEAFHILPQSAKWPFEPPGLHLLTLGFKSKGIGRRVEKWTRRRLSLLSDQKALFNTLKGKEAERYWKMVGQKVMSAMDFIRSTKLIDKRCPCSRAVEKLQQASLFGRMQHLEEQAQLLEQVMAEAATIPYLQDLSQEDTQLLELLMAEATDTFRGNTDNQRVWKEIQKIGVLEGYLHEVEDNYIKNKARTERRKKIQRVQQTQETWKH